MGRFTIEKYNSIKLDGICREGEELKGFCATQLEHNPMPEWQTHIYQFILQWLSPGDYVVAHTSGSTGIPKEIRLQKKYMLASAKKTVGYFNLTPEKTALLCLSANYIAGKMMLVRAFVGGFNLVLAEPTGTPLLGIPGSIDFAAMVPLQVYHSIPDCTKKIKSVIIGGGAVSSGLKKQLMGLPTRFYETYGMTETVSHVAIREIKAGCGFFKAMPNVFFEQDERGCLKIIAPDISEKKIITNDIVKLKNKHEFLFLGRYDSIINTGGVKIIPEEVEMKLASVIKVPFVISSLPDDKLGERVVMVLETSRGQVHLADFSSVLSKYEIPKEIKIIPNFPLTETGKIKRGEVKRLISGM
ncbi:MULTISPECIES: AMP-binding protein [unclassified Saccharicrinis]|uniref:AMP-binding protein n=1 Tax=unclassified Saccharicrinis TaxID=2646859 RepID=UPI003D34ED73